MATRFSPVTKGDAEMELLAGVLAGTAALYAGYRAFKLALAKHEPTYHTEFALFSWVREHLPDLDRYEAFDIYGWGKRYALQQVLTNCGHDATCGSTDDRSLIEIACAHFGVAEELRPLVLAVVWN